MLARVRYLFLLTLLACGFADAGPPSDDASKSNLCRVLGAFTPASQTEIQVVLPHDTEAIEAAIPDIMRIQRENRYDNLSESERKKGFLHMTMSAGMIEAMIRDGFAVLAYRGGRIVGFSLLTKTSNGQHYVNQTGVQRDQLHTGIGSAMLEKSKEISPAGIVANVYRDNEASYGMFKKAGFKEVDPGGSGNHLFVWPPKQPKQKKRKPAPEPPEKKLAKARVIMSNHIRSVLERLPSGPEPPGLRQLLTAPRESAAEGLEKARALFSAGSPEEKDARIVAAGLAIMHASEDPSEIATVAKRLTQFAKFTKGSFTYDFDAQMFQDLRQLSEIAK